MTTKEKEWVLVYAIAESKRVALYFDSKDEPFIFEPNSYSQTPDGHYDFGGDQILPNGTRFGTMINPENYSIVKKLD